MSTARRASASWWNITSKMSRSKVPGRGRRLFPSTPHALAPVAELPVLEVVSALHLVADLTLGLGRVAYDYLA